ncbi:MAG: MSHA biogenesis protein MshP [Telluria sp.]
MKQRMRQLGFAYIAAVVLLIVVAGLCVALLRLSNTQQDTVNQALLGARANLAARAGIEWGFYQLRNGSCATGTTLTDFINETGFRVTVNCVSRPFNEGETSSGAPIVKNSVRLEAFACNGGGACPSEAPAIVARPDYVERRRVATTCTMGTTDFC